MSRLGITMNEGEQSPRARRNRQRRRTRRRRRTAVVAIIALLLAIAVIVGLGYGAFLLGRSVVTDLFAPAADHPGPGTGEVVVSVSPGDSISTIGRTLEQAEVVASQRAFVEAAEDEPAATSIQPGSYAMRRQMSAQGALTLLLDPDAKLFQRVIVPEGLRMERTLDTLAQGTSRPREEFEAALADPEVLGLPTYADGEPEGFLFPATYEVEPDDTAADVLQAMTARFGEAAGSVGVEAGAAELGLTPREVVVVASLIEAEASRPEDLPRVARVIYNRLADGVRLQLDSTVNYVTGKTGITTSAEDRATASPYNTYAVAGLPPGPINSPGEAALAAAVDPAPGDWRFFVTVDPGTGETRFATTAAEHEANVELFRAWLREQG